MTIAPVWQKLNRVGAIALSGFLYLSCGAFREDSCAEESMRDLGFQGPCIMATELRGRLEVNIRTDPRCPWERLSNLEIFRGFKPWIKISEAKKIHGEPSRVRREPNSFNVFWTFSTELGEVQVSHEDQGSSFFIDRWWILSAKPKDTSPQQWLSKEVLDALPQRSSAMSVCILTGCGTPAVVVDIVGDKVTKITWLRSPGSWHPEARRAKFQP